MSKKALAIAGRTEGSRLPTFEVHQLRSAPRWYVRDPVAIWPGATHCRLLYLLTPLKAGSSRNRKGGCKNRTAALQSHDNQKGLCERFGGDQKCKITVHHGKNEMATS